ncbi:SLC13 family permease [Deinococcus maricopensis]|uniref:TrkA-C domain protein n=1 Tax=Deinococcus maricopensis (strain DSM 21211 / LMG 22137 / NRRL B-23946 / LB-34) TaxID=709986 RepID=E8UAY6_DEIML|nr:SLC13 family permease [Deinococcus maricopensis]ADV68225.1 TrkA-C domain protein [Deinococcus maricopensis DSM 21211]
MTLSIAVVLALFVAALILFATEIIAIDVTALLLLGALLLTGLLTPKEAFAPFGSDTVLTLAGLFILTRALLRTGVIERLGATLAARTQNATGMTRGVLMTVAGVSAFTSNTATTAVFLPVVLGLARRAGLAPSRVLMPLAYASILGGTITIIGTSTNLVVSGAVTHYGLRPLGFFELAWVGVPVAALGLLYLFFVAPRLIPERDAALDATYGVRAYLADLTIQDGSPLDGQTLRESGLGRDHGLTVLAVQRAGATLHSPAPDDVLRAGDTLVVEGQTERLLSGKTQLGVVSRPEQKLLASLEDPTDRDAVRLVEVVVMPRSPLIGRTLREAQFRARYGLSVLGVHRRTRLSPEGTARTRLQVGDVLLVQGPTRRVEALGDHLTVLGDLTSQQRDTRRAPLAVTLFLGAVLLGATGVLPLGVAVVVGAALAFALRVVPPEEGYASIEWPVLVLVACMLAFGAAFESSGAAKLLTSGLADVVRPLGPHVLLGVFYLITVILTQPMSNQAAALVMLPLGIGVARALDLNPMPFVIGITVAASNSFITPLEPSCMLVYGPGRYKFIDFVRVGSGLTLLGMIVSLIIIPWRWPF